MRDEPREDRGPVCPECGRACYTIYYRDGMVIGCDRCITERDASEVPECYGREE